MKLTTMVPPVQGTKSYDTPPTTADTQDVVELLSHLQNVNRYTASESEGGERTPHSIGLRSHWHECLSGPLRNIQARVHEIHGFKVGLAPIFAGLVDIGFPGLKENEHVLTLARLKEKFASSPRVNDETILPLKAKGLIGEMLDCNRLSLPRGSGSGSNNICLPDWQHTDILRLASDLQVSVITISILSAYRAISLQPEARGGTKGLHAGETRFARGVFTCFCEEMEFRARSARGLMTEWRVRDLEPVV